jgi:hypothetical protein
MSQGLKNLYDSLQMLIQVLPKTGTHNKAVIATYKHCASMAERELKKCEATTIIRGNTQQVTFNGTIIAVIESKQDWVNRVPYCLPTKEPGEVWVWIDRNGNCLTLGRDFSATEAHGAFPVLVYRLFRSSDFEPQTITNPTP